MICLTGLTFTGQAGIIGHTILMGGAVMADIFHTGAAQVHTGPDRAAGAVSPAAGPVEKARATAGAGVHGVQCVYAGRAVGDGAAGASMLGIHHAYAPMVLEPFRDLRLGYGNAERQVFLNVLMTVPSAFCGRWCAGERQGVPYSGGSIPAEPVHRADPTAAAHSTDVGHHRPDLQHCRRADRLRAVPAVEKGLGLLDVKKRPPRRSFLLIAGASRRQRTFWAS